ncbi:hypothetical protein SAMN04515654_11533 [Halanaerobium congolense]|jgi:hypothetical protein|uniref:Uncharacterized protein n=1 Tax=Halanaerobium congolense TaxID=54121 RepID=A0A1G8NIL5_9FIRM|nr:hypothetical protein [Halanaerobium congolense]SDI80089.1 hypothetical protein SAMN04515654_11533 [Halanaerobium congolense]SET49479.1 hypothetical protein SAMN04515653_11634 [Halanaerobium congolense]
MTIKDYYMRAKRELENLAYHVDSYKKINYGIQFKMFKHKQGYLVRVYEKKNKNINLDISLVKNKKVKKDLVIVENKLRNQCIDFKRSNLQESFQLINQNIEDEIIEFLISIKAKSDYVNNNYLKYSFKVSGLKFNFYKNRKMTIQGRYDSYLLIKKDILKIINFKKKKNKISKSKNNKYQLSLFNNNQKIQKGVRL